MQSASGVQLYKRWCNLYKCWAQLLRTSGAIHVITRFKRFTTITRFKRQLKKVQKTYNHNKVQMTNLKKFKRHNKVQMTNLKKKNYALSEVPRWPDRITRERTCYGGQLLFLSPPCTPCSGNILCVRVDESHQSSFLLISVLVFS